jgi:acetyl-CoA carboxylase, biotin carboxylase subunit
MFKKVLVANRGEIAARIMRTCKEMGVATVAIYSEADAGAPHTLLADEAFLVGGAHVTESYLNVDRIVEVVRETGADAVHPGYGLLSENARFVAAIEALGATFIGPSSAVMELMGDKARAREFAAQAGVPVVPGTPGAIASEDEGVAAAEQIGYPVLVKASGGGGGIGMKVAENEKKLRKAIQECQRRGESAFGNPDVYIEKYIQTPRHIEVQILADTHGHTLHLFERECSVQRRHQKVIEEAPSPLVSRIPGMRERITSAAVQLAAAAKYVNAGTIEFIADNEGSFYFIEMNTRLQVEHPVTEGITGLDIVAWQLRIAAGEALDFTQESLVIQGHAIECRVYAENPDKKFFPAPGDIGAYEEPVGQGIRVDSGVKAGWTVTPYYDPMVAKVVARGSDRAEAIARMQHALSTFVIEGLTHNISMHQRVLAEPAFVSGDFHTGWLETLYA